MDKVVIEEAILRFLPDSTILYERENRRPIRLLLIDERFVGMTLKNRVDLINSQLRPLFSQDDLRTFKIVPFAPDEYFIPLKKTTKRATYDCQELLVLSDVAQGQNRWKLRVVKWGKNKPTLENRLMYFMKRDGEWVPKRIRGMSAEDLKIIADNYTKIMELLNESSTQQS